VNDQSCAEDLTAIEGAPQVGQMVWVKAQVQGDGMLVAQRMSLALDLQNPSPLAVTLDENC
jgi:hypothetical protein